jgi:hypothetical protein
MQMEEGAYECSIQADVSHVAWRRQAVVESTPTVSDAPCWDGAPVATAGMSRRTRSRVTEAGVTSVCEIVGRSEGRSATGGSTTSRLESCIEAIRSFETEGECVIELTAIDGIPVEHFRLRVAP